MHFCFYCTYKCYHHFSFSFFLNFRGQTVEPLYSSFLKPTSPYPHPTTLGGRSTTCPSYSPSPSTPSTYRGGDEGGSPSPLSCLDSPRSVTSNSILSPRSTSCSVLSPRDTLAGKLFYLQFFINFLIITTIMYFVLIMVTFFTRVTFLIIKDITI